MASRGLDEFVILSLCPNPALSTIETALFGQ
jgi:hypothetical protein